MDIVILTALGVGGATVAGAVIGFLFRDLSRRFSDLVLSFAAGVMLAAAVIGLILPALELGSLPGVLAGVWLGGVCMDALDLMIPGLQKITQTEPGKRRVLMFVAAIAIHNLPEGIAAGVSFGTGSIREAIFIAGGIALQNIPEGLVIIAPMLCAGISPAKTFLIALLTGLIEVIGTLIGYFAVTTAAALLPFALAFAGGTMLYVICGEMIPQTHKEGSGNFTSYCLLAGFCVMLICDAVLS